MIKSGSATNKINEIHPNFSTTKQDSQTMELREGQTIKGEVIDLRYNGIRIRLEPGDQIIQGKLEANIPLSIGEVAKFQVTGDSSQRLTLKYLPSEDKAQTDLTIEKALSASKLPLTPLNKEIVEELLNHRMPIDKQTLQTLVRLSHGNLNASPLTLVLLKKHQIPMTTENISQFEAYQKGVHQLQDNIHDVLNHLSETVHSHSPEVNQDSILYNLHKGLLDLLISDNRDFGSEVKAQIIDAITNRSITLSEIEEILNKNLSDQVRENMNKSNEDKSAEFNAAELLMKALSSEEVQKENYLSSQSESKLILIIRKLLDQDASQEDMRLVDITMDNNSAGVNGIRPYHNIVSNSITLDSFLNPEEMARLHELLKSTTINQSLITQLKTGSATLQDIFHSLREGLQSFSEGLVKDLFSCEEYKKLLQEAFHERWTLSPEKLKDKEAVMQVYQNLHKDLTAFEGLYNYTKDNDPLWDLQQSSKNLQENLNFLKVINEIFTYLPLPIRLKQQDIHGDLYVFTKKENLNKKKQLNVLLNLDMTHLGPINIQIQMNEHQLQATFYTKDKEVVGLIKNNLPELTQVLEQRGYHLQARVEASYDQIDFSRDFIEQDLQSSPVNRYTFDIRT